MNEDSGEIERRAAEWVARTDGRPLDDKEREAFRRWLDAHPDHRPAFEEAYRSWRSLDTLRANPGAWQNAPRPARRKGPSRRSVAAILSVALLALAGLRYEVGDPWTAWSADYRTDPGERREVQLSDGSTIELGPASAVALHYTDAERRVSLLAGEAFFHVAPQQGDEHRTFIVEAGGGTTTALGTEFTVETSDGGANVVAVEHQILVAIENAATARSVTLSPVTLSAMTAEGLAGSNASIWREPWPGGRTCWCSMPRRSARWSSGSTAIGAACIVIWDPALAQRRVTGVFPTRDLGDAIETITSELGIRASLEFRLW